MTTTLESTLTSVIETSRDFADQPEALDSYLSKIEELKAATLADEMIVDKLTVEQRYHYWCDGSRLEPDKCGGDHWCEYFNQLTDTTPEQMAVIHQRIENAYVALVCHRDVLTTQESLSEARQLLPKFDPRTTSGKAKLGKWIWEDTVNPNLVVKKSIFDYYSNRITSSAWRL